MKPNIGRLLATDELLGHQIVDSFATVVESDLSWTEKIWMPVSRKDGAQATAATGFGAFR
jgi:hypothetical protein